MSMFKYMSAPEAASVVEKPEEVIDQEPKKRGPYKKKDKQAEKLSQMSPMEKVIYAVKDAKNRPSDLQLAEWKDKHGIFYMSSIDGQNVFLWRTLKRSEYKNLLASGATNNPTTMEEYVVRRCILWPTPPNDWFIQVEAGTISTLFKQIYYKSGFISDEEALTMIEKI